MFVAHTKASIFEIRVTRPSGLVIFEITQRIKSGVSSKDAVIRKVLDIEFTPDNICMRDWAYII